MNIILLSEDSEFQIGPKTTFCERKMGENSRPKCSCIFRLHFFYNLLIGSMHCNVAACFSFVYFFFFSCSSIFLCGEVFQKIFLFRISNTTVAKNKENWRVTIFKLREDFNHGIAMHCNGKQIS